MRHLTALFDAPLPAAAARRALAAAGFPDADVGAYAVPAGDAASQRGDLAAEIALRSERLAADPADGLAQAIALGIAARGVPAARGGDVARRVAAGRGWLVAVDCPDVHAAVARKVVLGAAPIELFEA